VLFDMIETGDDTARRAAVDVVGEEIEAESAMSEKAQATDSG